METNGHTIKHEHWDFSRWFAILSPVIGIILGFLGLFVFGR